MSKTTLSVTVEFVAPEHYPAWLVYWLEYQKFYRVDLSEEITLKAWERFLMKMNRCIVRLRLKVEKLLVL